MELQRYIETCIVPRYAAFDKAHGIDHARAVINRSLFYAGRYGADARMAYVIAAYHDLGLCEGRENHHIVSGNILAGDMELKRWFDEAQIEMMRQAVEQRQKSLDRYRLMIRLDPALGLLGTLIPMGSALAGVSGGELTVVSSELVVAFTTTVVGLAVGSAAFLIHSVKRRWVASDIRQIEYITEVMTP